MQSYACFLVTQQHHQLRVIKPHLSDVVLTLYRNTCVI